VRRHGPRGYTDYKHYKPWLRDEFSFRCAYCLCRESWFPDGESCFSVDHVWPRHWSAEPLSAYDGLVYACCVCNAFKRDFPDLFDFAAVALAEHLEVAADGTIRALSPQGESLIDVCALNRPELVAFRRDMQALVSVLTERHGEAVDRVRTRYLGYPIDLPDLAALRPPGGNARPDGIAGCHFERRRRGELTEIY
jgi:hypothetical protein